MKRIDIKEINEWSRFYRGNFVNCLSGYKPASLIGTANSDRIPNLAVFSNIVHLGADPALIGFINRPREAAPHTISNIESIGSYTINHIHPAIVQRAHQTSAKYDLGVDEFTAVGLTAEYKEGVYAPFVLESKVKYAMELLEVMPIKHNNTFFVIGKLKEAWIEESILLEDGYLDLEKVNSMVSLGIDGYYETKQHLRLPYAKVTDKETK